MNNKNINLVNDQELANNQLNNVNNNYVPLYNNDNNQLNYSSNDNDSKSDYVFNDYFSNILNKNNNENYYDEQQQMNYDQNYLNNNGQQYYYDPNYLDNNNQQYYYDQNNFNSYSQSNLTEPYYDQNYYNDYNNQQYYYNQSNFENNESQQLSKIENDNINSTSNDNSKNISNYDHYSKARTFFKDGVCYEKNDESYVSAYFNQNNLNNINESFEKIIEKKNIKRENKITEFVPYFKIVNLASEKNENYKVRLFNINVNFFSKDKIALISDNQNNISLFLDLIQNKIKRESGNIYSINSGKDNTLVDIYKDENLNSFKRNIDRNNLMDINYNKIAHFNKKTIESIIKKISNFYRITLNKNFIYNTLDSFKLLNFLNLEFNDLNIYQRNRFMFFCDVLVNKKVIKIKDVSNDLNLSDKINFYRYLNDYFFNKDNILLFISNDLTELKLLANRAIVFSSENIRFDQYFKDVIKQYNSIDEYIVLCLKN